MVKKISIIGSGAVGSSLGFHLLSRLDLEELVLVDTAPGLAQGVALDLEDTRGFLAFSTRVTGTAQISSVKNSDIVVITAGLARRQGMTRQDLLKTNAAVAKEVSLTIRELCSRAVVIVITNPLDFITYVVNKETGFARHRVLGMGSSLDTSRLLNILYQEMKTDISSLEGFVWGPHSKDMIVSPARIKVKGELLAGVLDAEAKDKIRQRVQSRGAEIVGCLKNRSAHFSPSLACFFLIEAIVNDRNNVIPVSVLLQGEYGLDDVCMGVPCVINRKGLDKIIQLELTGEEKREVEKAAGLFESMKASV